MLVYLDCFDSIWFWRNDGFCSTFAACPFFVLDGLEETCWRTEYYMPLEVKGFGSDGRVQQMVVAAARKCPPRRYGIRRRMLHDLGYNAVWAG